MRRSKKNNKKASPRVPLQSLEEKVTFLTLEEYEAIQSAIDLGQNDLDFYAVCFDDGEGFRPITKTIVCAYSNNKAAIFPLFQMPGSAEAFARDRRIYLKNKISANKLTKFKVVRGSLEDFRTVMQYITSKDLKFNLQISMAIVWPHQIKHLDGHTEELQVLDIIDQLHLN
jgi:hypothetical protein